MTAPWEFNGVVRLTRLGAGYVVFTIIVGFAALNTGNNSLYIGLSFMLGALLMSGVASKGGLRQLRLSLRQIEEAWAGAPLHVALEVENRSRYWNLRDLVFVSPDMQHAAYIPLLAARSGGDVPAVFLFERRGRVALRHIDIYSRYPFGLFLKKRRIPIASEAIVFPRLLDGPEADRSLVELVGEAARQARRGSGTEIYGFRDYVRGDSIRQVHWKKSASAGRWITKQPGAETRRTIVVVLDAYIPGGRSEADFERLVSAATTFVRDAHESDAEVALHLPGTSLRGGRASAYAMYEALALVEAREGNPMPVASRGAVVFSLREGHAAESA